MENVQELTLKNRVLKKKKIKDKIFGEPGNGSVASLEHTLKNLKEREKERERENRIICDLLHEINYRTQIERDQN